MSTDIKLEWNLKRYFVLITRISASTMLWFMYPTIKVNHKVTFIAGNLFKIRYFQVLSPLALVVPLDQLYSRQVSVNT